MNISEAARAAGLSAKAIRHYESLGILPKAKRTESGYRSYSGDDIHILRFVHRARSLGFSLAEIKQLLSLWRNKKRRSEEVKKIAHSHLIVLEDKIRELEGFKKALKTLVLNCQGDERPDCPILEDIGSGC